MAVILASISLSAAYSGGDGSSNNPFLIETTSDWLLINGSYYYQLNATELDFLGVSYSPISSFSGNLNLMGNTVSNVVISGTLNQAMFYQLFGAEIYNGTIYNSTVTGTSYVGTVAAKTWDDSYIHDINITECDLITSGTSFYSGTCAAYIDDSTISNVNTSGSITGSSERNGGVVGLAMNSSIIEYCVSDVGITATDSYCAGVVAWAEDSVIVRYCANYGDIEGTSFNSGIVGRLDESSQLYDSYNRGNVTGTSYVSGGVAFLRNSNVDNIYNSGFINESVSEGYGLIAINTGGTVTTSYYDINTSGQTTDNGGTGKTTSEMMLQSTYSGWDFSTVWQLEGYPILQFEELDYSLSPTIVYPINATEIDSEYPALTGIDFVWSGHAGASSSSYQLSRDSNYNTLVSSGTTTNNYKTLSLDADDYYFRVRYYYDTGIYSDWTETQFSINTTVADYGTGIQGVVYSLVGGSKTALNGVKVTAYDYDSNGNINNTFDYITGENGYYLFDDGFITAGTWYLVASKDGYETSSINSVQVVEGYTSIKDITLEEDNAPNYITPHYVRLIPKYLYIITYDDLLVTIYEGDSATSIFSDITGSDGAVGTELDETIKYRITVYNAEREIDDTFYITPTDSEYILPIGMGDDRYEEQETVTDISYSITQSNINLSSGYINCSYNDSSDTFTSSTFKIYDDNETLLYTLSSSSATNSYSQVVNASNYTYVATLTIVNSALDNDFSVSAVIHFFNGIQDSFDMGWENEWNYNVLAVIIIVLVGTLAGAVHAPVIALLQGAIFLYTLYIGWLPTRLDVIFMGVLGIVIAFMAAMRKGEEGMR